jgi:chromate reductase, NAD(P)H dehydrogenase (quinone)
MACERRSGGRPEAYIGGAAALLDKEENITNDGTRKFLKHFMEVFAAWIEVFLAR